MNITITPVPAKPVQSFAFTIGGLTGEIVPTDNDRWHAALSVPVPYEKPGMGQSTLLQGFGNTQEEAIRNMIECGLRHHELALYAVRQLKESLQ